MRAFPAHLVGLWATGNTALALGIIAYGEWSFAVLLHLGGSALVAVYGLAVLVAWRRHGVGPPSRVAYRSVAALAAGIVVLVVAVAAVYGWWALVLAPYPTVVALVMMRRERLPAGEAGTPPSVEVPVERPPTRVEVRAEALEMAHARKRRRRGEAT
jgi:hypothetical protein